MKSLTTILLAIIPALIFAGKVDTTQVGPGVFYYSETRAEGPWQFDILEVDLTNEWISIETVKADDLLMGFERTSSMAQRKDLPAHRVVGATNGDFYDGNGTPIGLHISNGEFVKSTGDWLHIGFNEMNKVMFGAVSIAGEIIAGDSSYSLTGVNKDRLTNELIIFNSYYGSNTGTNNWGTEVKLTPITDWIVNDTVLCIAGSPVYGVGSMTLNDGKPILSGHSQASSFIQNNINTGDTIKIVQKLVPGLDRMTQLIGGNTMLVQHGVNSGSSGDRHPRTAAGINQDTTKLFLFTVDGRQPGYSIGMTYYELASYMMEWGVWDGINLDGGGSTTMWVRGEIKNSPSDPGGERSVSNSLIVVSSAPTGPPQSLRVSPGEVYAIGGSSTDFEASLFDQYFNPLSINSDSLNWSCDDNIGVITQEGKFTAASDTITGYVYADYGNIRDSALVILTKIGSILLEPNPVILQPEQTQQMGLTAKDTHGNVVTMYFTDFTWTVTGDIGTITNYGAFTAGNIGSGFITAKYEDVEGSAQVHVGSAQTVILSDFSDLDGFSITGTNVNISECGLTLDDQIFVSSPSSARLQYSLTTGGTSALYVECGIPVSGTPEKVGLSLYGDGKEHWLRGEFQDADQEKFIVNFTESSPGINWSGSWNYLEVLFAEATPSWANPNAELDFPVTWTRIYLVETNDQKKDSGVIYLDDFTAHFIATGMDEITDEIPSDYKLYDNFPNPFNPATKIRYAIPEKSFVRLEIHDSLGKSVTVLESEEKAAGIHEIDFNAKGLASGIYFYTIKAGDFTDTRKMMLLK